MSTTIDSLQIEILSNSQNATSGLEALTQSLNKLKIATKGGAGLTSVAKQINSVGTAVNSINANGVSNVTGLVKAIRLLGGVSIPKDVAKQLKAVVSSINDMNIDSSKLDAFKTKISEVTAAVTPLATAMRDIKAGFDALPPKIQKVISVKEKLVDTNKKASMSFTDIYHGIKMAMIGITRFASLIGKAIVKSADYTENVNLFNVSLGSYASEAKEYAETVSAVMGIDTSDWMRAQGVFMTISTGFGVASDRAYTMSKNLTQLGYDISSFYNISVVDAMDKLKSGLAGELEPLRAIGYDLSQAKLEATALALGIDKSVSSMTQAEKAQLRYYAIMTQVTTAHGDMARTLNDPANQLRVFKAEVNMAAREIGNVFIPVLNALLPYAIALTKVIGSLASVIAGLFKDKSTELDTSTSSAADNTSAIQENLKESQEEAKKLKSYMLGFDELNVINPNEGATDDSSVGFDFELPEYDFMKDLVESKVNTIVEDMKEWLGITEDITSWSDLISTNFGNILVTVGLIGVGLMAWKISKLIPDMKTFKKLLTGISSGFSVMLKAMGITAVSAVAIASADWLIKHTDDTITKIGAVLSAASLVVGSILAFTGINLPLGIALMAVGAVSMASAIAMNTEALSDEIKGVIGVITGMVSLALLAVGAILAFSGTNIPLGIALMAGGALTLATAVVPNWDVISEALRGPVGAVTAIVSGALLVLGAILAFSGAKIPLGIALMATGAVGLASAIIPNWDSIVTAMRGPVGKIMAIAGASALVIGLILLFTGVGIPLGLGLILGGAAALGSAIAFNWDSIVDAVKGVWKKITKFWDDNIAPVFTAKWWKNLGITIINGLIAGIEGGINGIISAFESMINWIVRGLNKISFNVPDWVPGIGGKKFGFNIPLADFGRVSIPRFAEGGYPATGQMFIAREAGPEMVGNIGRRTAVANNDQIVESISVGVAEANSEQNALLREQNTLLRALLEKDIGVYLDGRALSGSVEKHRREQGRVLITGGAL